MRVPYENKIAFQDQLTDCGLNPLSKWEAHELQHCQERKRDKKYKIELRKSKTNMKSTFPTEVHIFSTKPINKFAAGSEGKGSPTKAQNIHRIGRELDH